MFYIKDEDFLAIENSLSRARDRHPIAMAQSLDVIQRIISRIRDDATKSDLVTDQIMDILSRGPLLPCDINSYFDVE
jgi:hypothetical protein